MIGRYILCFLAGGGLGYFVFYIRFAQKEIVSDLRSHLKTTQKELNHISTELDEHLQQNMILKEKMTDLISTNNDLSKVVGQLSRYYYHIKVGAEKVAELTEFLKLPDESIEEKMQRYIPAGPKHTIKTHLSVDSKDGSNKQF